MVNQNTYQSDTLSITDITQTVLELNPGLRCKKQATTIVIIKILNSLNAREENFSKTTFKFQLQTTLYTLRILSLTISLGRMCCLLWQCFEAAAVIKMAYTIEQTRALFKKLGTNVLPLVAMPSSSSVLFLCRI